MLRARIRTTAKTCSAVSYAPRSRVPQAGFSDAVSSCRLESSARRRSVGMEDHDMPADEQVSVRRTGEGAVVSSAQADYMIDPRESVSPCSTGAVA